MDQITLDMEIEDIVEKYPQTIAPMQEMGVQCMLCGEPVWGTLGQRIKEKELTNSADIIRRLNEVIKIPLEKKGGKRIEVKRY